MIKRIDIMNRGGGRGGGRSPGGRGGGGRGKNYEKLMILLI